MPRQPSNRPTQWVAELRRVAPVPNTRHPETPPPGPEDEAEHQAPQGEPAPIDNAPRFQGPPPRSPDVYATTQLTVPDVMYYRPRWSEARCRAWLVQFEASLHEGARSDLMQRMRDYLDNDAPPLLRDRDPGRRIPTPQMVAQSIAMSQNVIDDMAESVTFRYMTGTTSNSAPQPSEGG